MNKALKVFLLLTAMLAAGCTDATLSAPKSDASGEALMAKGGIPGKPRASSDTAFFNFKIITNKNSVLDLGDGSSVSIPAGTVCDPYTSSYGEGTWDDPCNTMNGSLVVTARYWIDANHHPRVDFSPDLRFTPTRDPAKFVIMTFVDAAAAQRFDTEILYCRTITTGCVKESSNDPTLTTVTDPATGQVRRRIKHFSGYSITTGEECYDFTDPDCVDDGAFTRGVRNGLEIKP